MRLTKHLRNFLARVAPYLALAAVAFVGLTSTAYAVRPVMSPEIDPGSIGAAITLFVGGAMYLTSRRHAK